MEFARREQGNVTILTVQGSIHAGDNDAFASALDGLRAEGRLRLVLDARGIDYVNSRAVGTLVGFQRDARLSGGKLVLVSPGSTVKKLLHAVGLLSLVPTYDTLDEALQACAPDEG